MLKSFDIHVIELRTGEPAASVTEPSGERKKRVQLSAEELAVLLRIAARSRLAWLGDRLPKYSGEDGPC